VPSDSATRAQAEQSYPPIGDYALISDCQTVALINRQGSIDWCAMPRIDSSSAFGRLLDWRRGGFCHLAPTHSKYASFRGYLDDTMVLSTTFAGPGGEARVTDLLVVDPRRPRGHPQIVRVVDGLRGKVPFTVRVAPRFDYGEVRPWLRYFGRKLYCAIGGDDGLLIASDVQLERDGEHDLVKEFAVSAKQRIRFSIQYTRPSQIDPGNLPVPMPEELDEQLRSTLDWWRHWAAQIRVRGTYAPGIKRSALALKALTIDETGAIAAAATTSLPEVLGGGRNWDYRFSWIRDSTFAVRSLADIGCEDEAGRFRRFIQESAAGAADDLQIMYGVGGERRLTELELPMEGYRGSRPVRVGNAAHAQLQLDVFGEILELTWRWHMRGHSPDDDYWRFLVALVDRAAAIWNEPDRGLWEIRGTPKHFVHSKVMLWAALDRGIQLAKEGMRAAPVDRWRRTRDQIRRAVERKGFDRRRNTFVQAFGERGVDAALLLLPAVGFIDYSDPRMVGTVDAIREDLDSNGLILRYRTTSTDDGMTGKEGSFLACSLWLVECLAHQGRLEEARLLFDRVVSAGNDLGLFSEEYDTDNEQMAGNFPQALTHLSHISAAVALTQLMEPGSAVVAEA
jgi:GH15 family glucan-1,4-alpha-glucosidase